LDLVSLSVTRSPSLLRREMRWGTEILITNNAASGPNHCLYRVPIGYVSQPKQDKRNQHFVSAKVNRGGLGIGM